MSRTGSDIHHRRLRAIFLLEFRVGLYQWQTRRLLPRPALWAALLAGFGVAYGLPTLGYPSLVSQLPAHAVPGALWVAGVLVLALGTASLLCATEGVAVAWCDTTDLLPISRARAAWAAMGGRALASGVQIAVGAGLLLVAWPVAGLVGGPPPGLNPLAAWLLATPFVLLLGCAATYLKRVAESIGAAWLVLPQLGIGGYAAIRVGLDAARQVAPTLQLMHGVAVGTIVLACVGYLVAGGAWVVWWGVHCASRRRRRRAGATAGRRRWRPDFRSMFHPELGARRWLRSALAGAAVLGPASVLWMLGWSALMTPGADGRPDLRAPVLGLAMLTVTLPLAAIPLTTMMWGDSLTTPRRRRWSGPHAGELIPFPRRHVWRARMKAALGFGVACSVLAWALLPLDYAIARAFGAQGPLPPHLQWSALAAPALALVTCAIAALLRALVRVLPSLWALLPVEGLTGGLAFSAASSVADAGALRGSEWLVPAAVWLAAPLVVAYARRAEAADPWQRAADGRLTRGTLARLVAGIAVLTLAVALTAAAVGSVTGVLLPTISG